MNPLPPAFFFGRGRLIALPLLKRRLAQQPTVMLEPARVESAGCDRVEHGTVWIFGMGTVGEPAPPRKLLVGQAYVFGTDAYLFLDTNRDWVITGKMSRSRISGSPDVMDRVQRTPQRYYQRPDAPHILLDPSRTTLGGWAGWVNLNRNSGLWHVNAAL